MAYGVPNTCRIFVYLFARPALPFFNPGHGVLLFLRAIQSQCFINDHIVSCLWKSDALWSINFLMDLLLERPMNISRGLFTHSSCICSSSHHHFSYASYASLASTTAATTTTATSFAGSNMQQPSHVQHSQQQQQQHQHSVSLIEKHFCCKQEC